MSRFAYAKKYLHVYLITIIVIKKHVNNTNVHDKKQLVGDILPILWQTND